MWIVTLLSPANIEIEKAACDSIEMVLDVVRQYLEDHVDHGIEIEPDWR
jgi:hypothetical protein